MTTPLLSLSPIDGRYANKSKAIRKLMSEHALIKQRVLIEIRWLQHLAAEEIIPMSAGANDVLEKLITNFTEADSEAVKTIEQKTNHDVKAVEYFLKEKLTDYPELQEFIHFGATSEDINNLAYALMLKEVIQTILTARLTQLNQQLTDFAHKYAKQPMLARTHGQAATPTTVGKEFANFVYRLQRQLTQLDRLEYLGKFNGATGNFNALQIAYPKADWLNICQSFVEALGLTYNPYTTQIEPHDFIAELSHCLVRINNILIDLSRDCWGYISLNYFQQETVSGEIGSSTMPHKVNPIQFENAEGNLGVANALLTHFANKLPISRYQRDLSDSTVLRYVGQSLASCDIAYQAILSGLKRLDINRAVLEQDLNSNISVLAEAIQTVMRAHGKAESYEQLKDLTRGKEISVQDLAEFIDSLDLPTEVKAELNKLRPENYIGLAQQLAMAT